MSPRRTTQFRVSVIWIAGTRTGCGTALVEAEDADRRIGLDVVHLVQPPVKAEFQLVLAVNLIERGRQLAGILPEPVVAVRICARAA